MSQGRRSKALVLGVFFLTVVGVPVFELCGGSFPGAGVPSSWSSKEVLTGRMRRIVERDLERNSHFAATVRPYYTEGMLRLFRETTASVVLCPDDWMYLAYTVRGYPPAGHPQTIENTVTLIESLGQWFESQGTAMLVCVVPNKATLYPDSLQHVRPRVRSAYAPIWERIASSSLWSFDLRPVLDPDEYKSFLSYDTHWTPEGALSAAGAMVTALEERWPDALPGRAVTGEVHHAERSPRAGALYMLMALREGCSLEDRFSEVTGEIYGRELGTGTTLGVSTEEELVLVGTSFSHQYRLASLVSALAGRHVQNRSIFGQGPTRAVLEIAGEVHRGERPAPRLVIWEFPERYFFESPALMQEPLRQFLRSLEFADEAAPLAFTSREAANLEFDVLDDGSIQGEPRPRDPSLVYELERPLPGDGTRALVYTVTADRTTVSFVHFDVGQGFEELLQVSSMVPKRHVPQQIVVPIQTPDGAPVHRIRIDPVRGKMAFRMSPVEVRERRQP